MKKILLVISGVFLVITAYFHRANSMSLHFVDEEDNFVVAKYLLTGRTLYSDLYSQHQPLPYVLSAGIQAVTTPNSLYELIIRHREFVILISAVFSLGLVWVYGWTGLAFILVFEPAKSLLLGNLFLAESLSIYPLLFLLGESLTPLKPSRLRLLLLGFLFSWTALTLAPLWPLLLLIAVILAIKYRHNYHNYLYFILAALPLFLLCLLFSSPADYLRTIFFENSRYYIPFDPTRVTPANIWRSFLSPLLTFFHPVATSLHLEQLFSTVLLALVTFRWRLFRTKWWLIFIVLGLANIRFIAPGHEYYFGFHLLPWLAVLIFVVFLLLGRSKISYLLVALSLLITLPVFTSPRNKDLDYYINYSRQFDIGEAVRIMSAADPSASVFVVPDEALVYWLSEAKPASKFLFFYPWMEKIPAYTDQITNIFSTRPPAYFYCECQPGSFFSQFLTHYHELAKFDQSTQLYVRNDLVNSFSAGQLSGLEYLGFKL